MFLRFIVSDIIQYFLVCRWGAHQQYTLLSGCGYIYPFPFTPLPLAVHTYVYILAWLWSWIALVVCPLPYLGIDSFLTPALLPLLNFSCLLVQSFHNNLIIIRQFTILLMGTACIVSQQPLAISFSVSLASYLIQCQTQLFRFLLRALFQIQILVICYYLKPFYFTAFFCNLLYLTTYFLSEKLKGLLFKKTKKKDSLETKN